MTFVVVATGNHFLVDAVLGAAIDAAGDRGAELRTAARLGSRCGARRRGPSRASRLRPSDHRTAARLARPPPAAAAERREIMRNRLIESRLTPNAISLDGHRSATSSPPCSSASASSSSPASRSSSARSCDTLDGRYSRMSGKGTPFGAFLDSTLDRIEEGIVLTAVAAYFAARGDDVAVAAVVLAVLVSLMVCYTRARAEALGVECKVGIATRAGARRDPVASGCCSPRAPASGDFELLAPAVYVLAGLAIITTFQRIFHVRKALTAPAA